MSIVIHIGLAKCASTSLQKYVFPELSKMIKNIEFNNEKLTSLSYLRHFHLLNKNNLSSFNKVLNNGRNHLISSEFLVNRDPLYWEDSADINLELFGKDTTVIVVVKDTMPYLRSIYLQTVHEGSGLSDSDFFDHEKALHNKRNKLVHFSPDSFLLEELNKIYTRRFKNVHFVPLSRVSELLFLQEIYGISNAQLKYLQGIFKKSPKANVSYSSMAVRISLKRAQLIEMLRINKKDITPEEKISQSHSKYALLYRRISWRNFIRRIGVKSYSLSKNIAISKSVLQSNSSFINKIYNQQEVKK